MKHKVLQQLIHEAGHHVAKHTIEHVAHEEAPSVEWSIALCVVGLVLVPAGVGVILLPLGIFRLIKALQA